MRQRIILSAIIFLGCWPGVASAQNIRSNDLMAHCTLSTGPDDYCKGFLNGYSDAASAFQTREMLLTMRATSPPGNPPYFCLSNSDTDEALAQTFIAYMRAHPEMGNDFANATVLEALSSRYPCKAQ